MQAIQVLTKKIELICKTMLIAVKHYFNTNIPIKLIKTKRNSLFSQTSYFQKIYKTISK